MPAPKNTLKITRINEISFVGKGDNPPAGVTILKAAPLPPNGGPLADTPIVEKALEERLAKAEAEAIEKAERLEKAERALAKMEEDAAVALIAKGLPQGVDASLAADLRTVQKASPEAYARINGVIGDLAKRANAVGALTTRIGSVGKAATGGAEAQIEALAKACAKADGIPYAEAYAKVLNDNQALYMQYKQEQA